jgi:hypothetical protein
VRESVEYGGGVGGVWGTADGGLGAAVVEVEPDGHGGGVHGLRVRRSTLEAGWRGGLICEDLDGDRVPWCRL